MHMNPESPYSTPIVPPVTPEHEIPTDEVAPTASESTDEENFERAKAMESIFHGICAEGSDTEKNIKSILIRRFAKGLLELIDPASNQPYTHEGLNKSFWLYHIITYDTLRTSERKDFDPNLKYDLPDGEIERFILSLPEATEAAMVTLRERQAAKISQE